MLEWNGVAWLVSVVAVGVSGGVAAMEGHWRHSARVQVGFATHGGMWGDAVLLPVANALVVPWIQPGRWLAAPLLVGGVASIVIHAWWHRGRRDGMREHMWPTRPTGRWHADLSWSGWCHVVYVALEVALLVAYLASPMPRAVVLIVTVLLSAHVPLGVLLPPWTATGRVFREDVWQTAMAVAAVWIVAAVKLADA